MRITKLILKDFGRHENLTCDLDGPIAGVIGPNGSGKSTIMEALRFGLTGSLTDENASYVRGWGKLEGVNNGSVELLFRKGGVEGSIFRQIGKSPRALLKWDGQEIKSVKEIERVIADVLGADKQARDNAVFIAQGDLSNLLFGDDADREQLYSRLLMVSFCAKIHDQLAIKLRDMVGSLSDVTALRDEVVASLEVARAAQQALAAESAELTPFTSEQLEAVQRLLESLQLLMERRQRVAHAQEQTLVARDNATKALLAWKDGVEFDGKRWSLVQSKQLQDIIRARNVTLATELKQLTQLEAAYTGREQRSKELANLKLELEQLERDLTNWKPKTLTPEVVQQLHKQLQNLELLETTEKEIPDLKTRVATGEKLLEQVQLELPAVEKELGEKEGREGELRAALRLPSLTLELHTKLRAADSALSAESCPCCGGKLHGGLDSAIYEEALRQKKAIDAELGPLSSAVVALRQKLKTLQANQGNYVATLTQRREQLQLAEGRAKSLLASVEPRQPAAWVREKLSEHETALRHIEALNAQAGSSRSRSSAVAASLTHFNETIGSAPRPTPESQKQHQDTLNYLAQLDAWVTDARDVVAVAETKRDAADKNLDNAQTALAECQTSVGVHEQSVSMLTAGNSVFAAFQQSEENTQLESAERVERWLSSMDLYNQKARDVKSRFIQQTTQVDAQRERLAQIENAMARHEKQQRVIGHLRQLQNMFGKEGLPLAYMRHRFGEISKLTSRYLGDLDANFIIRPAENRPVSFEFQRMDETSVWLPQGKLSGGQRVRLAVAFLMAIQALVLPDVGLLVLDEPSVHLDEAGRESLRDMLVSLASKLNSTDMQVIVCDHSQEIADALPAKVKTG